MIDREDTFIKNNFISGSQDYGIHIYGLRGIFYVMGLKIYPIFAGICLMTVPVVTNSQTFNDGGAYMLIYEDAKVVNEAEELIRVNKLDSARILLDRVIAKTPDDYSNDYFIEDKHYIEFWNIDELYSYLVLKKDSTIFAVQNAYSRAHFWGAWIYHEKGQIQKAQMAIWSALQLEPDHPDILCEAAIAFTPENLFKVYKDSLANELVAYGDSLSLGMYYQALNSREYITPDQKGRALRGLGVTLVEIGNLELAKAVLNESLKYENSQIAIRELNYINNIIKGGEKNKMRMVKPVDIIEPETIEDH